MTAQRRVREYHGQPCVVPGSGQWAVPQPSGGPGGSQVPRAGQTWTAGMFGDRAGAGAPRACPHALLPIGLAQLPGWRLPFKCSSSERPCPSRPQWGVLGGLSWAPSSRPQGSHSLPLRVCVSGTSWAPAMAGTVSFPSPHRPVQLLSSSWRWLSGGLSPIYLLNKALKASAEGTMGLGPGLCRGCADREGDGGHMCCACCLRLVTVTQNCTWGPPGAPLREEGGDCRGSPGMADC